MNKEHVERLENALLAFVERAASERATPEEVQALPGVARVLAETLKWT